MYMRVALYKLAHNNWQNGCLPRLIIHANTLTNKQLSFNSIFITVHLPINLPTIIFDFNSSRMAGGETHVL